MAHHLHIEETTYEIQAPVRAPSLGRLRAIETVPAPQRGKGCHPGACRGAKRERSETQQAAAVGLLLVVFDGGWSRRQHKKRPRPLGGTALHVRIRLWGWLPVWPPAQRGQRGPVQPQAWQALQVQQAPQGLLQPPAWGRRAWPRAGGPAWAAGWCG